MITLTTEQAQQIEEALLRVEQNAEECMGDDGMVMVVPLDLYNELTEALSIIRSARAQEQAEQEPVAWVDLTREELHQIEMTCETSAECYRVIAKALKDRNYAAPVRTKDLTDDEIMALVREAARGSTINRDGSTSHRIARAVIAADREKNK